MRRVAEPVYIHTYIHTYIVDFVYFVYFVDVVGLACTSAWSSPCCAAVRMEAEAGPFRVVVFQVCACLAECTKHTHTTRKLSKTASFNESFDSRIRRSCPEVAWG